MTARKEVDEIINLACSVNNKPERVFICKELYKRFEDEMMPIYKRKYLGLLSHEPSSNLRYQNIMYRGLWVCLMKVSE